MSGAGDMSERGFVVALLGAESTGKTTLAAEIGAALFAYKGLWLTTVLYVVFVAMAAVGWRGWRLRAMAVEAAR